MKYAILKQNKKLGWYNIMFVYYVEIDEGVDLTLLSGNIPKSRQKPVKSISFGPVFAYSLLLFVLNRHCGIENLNSIEYTKAGKPFLPQEENIHFSLSHTDTHCLCALSENPVGADVQTVRQISHSLPPRVLGAGESPDRFFDYWVLKESFIKLLGDRDRPYQEISFSLNGDRASLGDVNGYVFNEIPNCSAAVCAHGRFDRPTLVEVSPKELEIALEDIFRM